MFDFIAISGSLDGRVIEYVDHLHEHFVDPVRVRGGRYLVPEAPGYSITMKPESLARFTFPDGPAWNPAAENPGGATVGVAPIGGRS
jgi:L-fuconate dehydratase